MTLVRIDHIETSGSTAECSTSLAPLGVKPLDHAAHSALQVKQCLLPASELPDAELFSLLPLRREPGLRQRALLRGMWALFLQWVKPQPLRT